MKRQQLEQPPDSDVRLTVPQESLRGLRLVLKEFTYRERLQDGTLAPTPEWMSHVRLYTAIFWLRDKPLAATPYWRTAPQVIAPFLSKSLLSLRGHNNRLLLSPTDSSLDYRRRVGGRPRYLTAQEAVYFDYVLTGKCKDFIGVFGVNRTARWVPRWARILVEVEDAAVPAIMQEFFEWQHAMEGYVVPDRGVTLKQLISLQPWQLRRHVRLLDRVLVYFEEWADGSGLRFWTTKLQLDELASAIDIAELNRGLANLAPSAGRSGAIVGKSTANRRPQSGDGGN